MLIFTSPTVWILEEVALFTSVVSVLTTELDDARAAKTGAAF
jgi:hypothetical protein